MSQIPKKKQWQKPMLWVLDTTPQGGGHNMLVHEATGYRPGQPRSVHGTTPGQKITNQINTSWTAFRDAVS